MTHGYASDIDGDDTVMGDPEVTVSIDLSTLRPEQALMIVREAGPENFDPYLIGQLMSGKDVTTDLVDATFHFPIGEALTVLNELGAVNIQPSATPLPEDDDDE